MTPRVIASTLFPSLLLAWPALAQAPPEPRADLALVEALLDEAVSQVSRPSVHVVLGGREVARGYRFKGVGAIFVLPPRALPGAERDRFFVFDGRAPHPAMLRKLSRDQERELRAIQEQVEALQREAETAQREAERALEKVERNIRIRMVPSPAFPAHPPQPPAAPEGPAAPEAPVAPPMPEELVPGLPPPPPWRFWFETGDDRTPDRVIADVQAAVTTVLETQGTRLRTVPPDELILVAVDFLPTRGFDFDTPPGRERSLVVKVRKRDLVDRNAGKISAEELRRRIDYAQY